jgi:hypothetical protein
MDQGSKAPLDATKHNGPGPHRLDEEWTVLEAQTTATSQQGGVESDQSQRSRLSGAKGGRRVPTAEISTRTPDPSGTKSGSLHLRNDQLAVRRLRDRAEVLRVRFAVERSCFLESCRLVHSASQRFLEATRPSLENDGVGPRTDTQPALTEDHELLLRRLAALRRTDLELHKIQPLIKNAEHHLYAALGLLGDSDRCGKASFDPSELPGPLEPLEDSSQQPFMSTLRVEREGDLSIVQERIAELDEEFAVRYLQGAAPEGTFFGQESFDEYYERRRVELEDELYVVEQDVRSLRDAQADDTGFHCGQTEEQVSLGSLGRDSSTSQHRDIIDFKELLDDWSKQVNG